MSNKFLERYQALWEPRIGDRVEIVQVLDLRRKCVKVPWFYQIGDVGVIEETGSIAYSIMIKNNVYTLYREEFKLI